MHENADSGQDNCLPCVDISLSQEGLHHPLLRSSCQEGLRSLGKLAFLAAVEDEHRKEEGALQGRGCETTGHTWALCRDFSKGLVRAGTAANDVPRAGLSLE